MRFPRMPIEAESPEERGYETLRFNLAESSVRDRPLAGLMPAADLVLAYGDHRGRRDLREAVARRAGVLGHDDVLITAGAAQALFLIALTLLGPGDHLIVERPNYATNLVTPRSLGCAIDYLDLTFESGFALDAAALERRIRPQTRLISLTTPHNPTGVCLGEADLVAALATAERAGAHLLVDETYREMSFTTALRSTASLGPAAISVGSLSKSFGIPGVRIGWIACADQALMHALLCAREQTAICGSVLDEAVAAAAMAEADAWLAESARRLAGALATVRRWMAGEARLEWVEPAGGCVCFPRIRGDARIDVAEFYRILDAEGVAVGPGHWFEQDDAYFRLGFGWPTPDELAGGLAALSAALDAAQA